MSTHDPLDTAWRIHSTVLDWTARAETKASFTLTIASAVIAGVVALSAGDRRFGNINEGAEVVTYSLGLISMLMSVVAAACAVYPQTRREAVETEAPDNFIFFGHLTFRKASELEDALRHQDPLPVLSRQLVRISKIAWFKHQAVAWAMMLGGVGVLFLVMAYAFATPVVSSTT
ncbi:Pycsar system effector family protein [Aquipuribacter sp. MA13-6]|uniref:Pycsar system effector family protein n=1 Tax=unclassified Aquipuribacter TaxID=2635084 RepID=UPI003EF05FF4